MAESPESQFQDLNLQGVKQTNGVEYMNGNGVDSQEKMDDFEAQFQTVSTGKTASGLDPNATPFEPFSEHSNISTLQASDQSVPFSDITQPQNMAAVPDQQPQADEGVLIDFGGKDEVSSPAPYKGEGHLDTFSMEVGQTEFSSSEGGQPLMDDTLPQGMGVNVEGSKDNFDQDQGASEMECQCDNYEPDQSLSQNVSDLPHSQNMNPSLSNVPHEVMDSKVAQEEGTVPMSHEDPNNQPAYQYVSSHERNSFDEQIVPGVCSCTDEPEPESPQGEVIKDEQTAPQAQCQSDEEYDAGEDDGEYYDDGSDVTDGEDVDEDQRRNQDVQQGEEEEEAEVYTDDGDYSDEEDYDGPDSYRASEEREVISDYDGESRSSEERQMEASKGEIIAQTAPTSQTAISHVVETQKVPDSAESDVRDFGTENVQADEMEPEDVTTEGRDSGRISEERDICGVEVEQKFGDERETVPLDEDERMDQERECVHYGEVEEDDREEREETSDGVVDEVKPQEDMFVTESNVDESIGEKGVQREGMDDQFGDEKEESFEVEREISEERNFETEEPENPVISDLTVPPNDQHVDVVQDNVCDSEEPQPTERLLEFDRVMDEKCSESDEVATENMKEKVSVDDIVIEDRLVEPTEKGHGQVPDVILTTMKEAEVPDEFSNNLDAGGSEDGEVEIQSNVSEFGSQYAEVGDERMDEEESNGYNGEPGDEDYPDEREDEIEREDFNQQEHYVEQEERKDSERICEDVIPQVDQMESLGFHVNERETEMPEQGEQTDSFQYQEEHKIESVGIVEKLPSSEDIVQEPLEEHRQKADTFIESEGSDMEERSITPDPDQMLKMASPRSEVPQDVSDTMFHNEEPIPETAEEQSEDGKGEPEQKPDAMTGSFILDEGETIEDHVPTEMSKSMMEGSLILNEGQTIEDAQPVEDAQFEESPDDEIVPPLNGNAMEGSLIMDEGQTIEDLPAEHTSVMEGSFVMDKGQTIEDLPAEEQTRSVMEGSLIMDEGQTVEDIPQQQDVMSRSLMEDSIVMDEGETFDNQEIQAEHSGSTMEDTNTSEDSQASQKMNVMTGSMMEGSIVLDEDEKLEDRFPEDAMSKSMMEESATYEEEQTFESLPANVAPEPLSERYNESQTEDSLRSANVGYMSDQASIHEQTAQNMVENVLNDAIDTVESMQRTDDISVEEASMERIESGIEECVPDKSEEKSSEKIDVSVEEPSIERSESAVEESIPDRGDISVEEYSTGKTEESLVEEPSFEKSLETPVSEPPPEKDFSVEEYSTERTEESAVDEGIPDRGDISVEEYSMGKTEESLVEEPSVEKSVETPVSEPLPDRGDISVEEPSIEKAVETPASEPPPEKVEVAEDKPKKMVVEKETAPEKEKKVDVIVKTDEAIKKEKVMKEHKQVTKTEKDKKNVSVLSKEHKKEVKEKKDKQKPKAKVPAKSENKSTGAKSENEKTPAKDNKYSHITSRLTQDTSASLARKTVKRSEVLKQQPDSKIPSPEKGDIARRSQSATRQVRSPRKPKDVPTPGENRESISRSKSTPRPGFLRRQSPSPLRSQVTTTRNARPTKLLQPRKDLSSANGVTSPTSGTDEEKAGKRTPSASSKKKYGIDSKNSAYKPGGGHVKIFDQKVQVKATPRIDARAKTPTGPSSNTSPRKESPRPKPTTPKGPSPNVKNVTSRIGSLQNATHSPGGGQVKIATKKTDYSTVTSRIGSTANMDHRPGGGDKKILSQKLDWKTNSKIGSMENAKHSPGGGNVKIMNEKVEWNTASKIGSLDNASHVPGGGKVKIESHKLDFKAQSKVGSTDYMTHKPGGGNKKIETQKLDFKEKAKPKVESKTNHKPAGGDKKIESQKLSFKESAKSRTDSGTATPKAQTESVNSQDSIK